MRMLVSSLEDVLVAKLLALNEQEPDYAPVLEIARTLREQIEWDEVRERTASSPFAKAFFTLVEELGIVPSAPAGGVAAHPGRVRARSRRAAAARRARSSCSGTSAGRRCR